MLKIALIAAEILFFAFTASLLFKWGIINGVKKKDCSVKQGTNATLNGLADASKKILFIVKKHFGC